MAELENSQQNKATNANPCGVDLNWLAGRTIVRVTNELAAITIEFDDGLVFKIQALLYKGEPFVGISPYKEP